MSQVTQIWTELFNLLLPEPCKVFINYDFFPISGNERAGCHMSFSVSRIGQKSLRAVCMDLNRFVSHCSVPEHDIVLGEGGRMVHYSALVGLVTPQSSSTSFKG